MTQVNQSKAGTCTIVTVGVITSAKLQQQGNIVRRVARSLGVGLSDRNALNRTFAGADSAYVMIPFDVQVPDLHRFEREVGNRLVEAISTSGVSRAVLLSGLNAHLKMRTSLGATGMEDRLDALGLNELVHLRAGFFVENFMNGMGFIAQSVSGVFATPFGGDLLIPLIAARDIGERVADLLTAEDWPRDRVIEPHGGGRYTLSEGNRDPQQGHRPDVACQIVPYGDARASMIESGISTNFADALIETAMSFNNGERWALEAPGGTPPRSRWNAGPTMSSVRRATRRLNRDHNRIGGFQK
jgi:hypothetical protein